MLKFTYLTARNVLRRRKQRQLTKLLIQYTINYYSFRNIIEEKFCRYYFSLFLRKLILVWQLALRDRPHFLPIESPMTSLFNLLSNLFTWLFKLCLPFRFSSIFQTVFLFKVNNLNTRTICEICWKLTIKTRKRRQWHRFGVFFCKIWTDFS